MRRAPAIGISALVVGGLLALAMATAVGSPEPAPSSLPVEITVTLDRQAYYLPPGDETQIEGDDVRVEPTTDGGRAVMTTDKFVWAWRSATDWTWTKLCCADPLTGQDDSGSARQIRPDGTLWHRDSSDDTWEQYASGANDGRIPLPDLAPSHPTAERQLEEEGAEVLGAYGEARKDPEAWNKAVEAAANIGVADRDLIVYEIAQVRRAVYAPLNLPLHVTERDANGTLVRELRVTRIVTLP